MSMPSKEYYLKFRNIFIQLAFYEEVYILDSYYELVFIYSKENQLIKIM